MTALQWNTASIKTAGRKTKDLIKLKPSVALGQIAQVMIPKSQLIEFNPILGRVNSEVRTLVFDLAIQQAYELSHKV